MTHPARHSRPKERKQIDQHALGSLLEDIGSRRRACRPEQRAEHAEQRAEHAQQQQHPETTTPPMSLRQDVAHASLTVPNRSAQQMAFDASPRTEATRRGLMLRARDATDSTDSPVAMRPLDARATCCGTNDMLHEASNGTGTALGGALHAACVWQPVEHEESVPAQKTMGTLHSQLHDVTDKKKLEQLFEGLQVAQTIVMTQLCRATRHNYDACTTVERHNCGACARDRNHSPPGW